MTKCTFDNLFHPGDSDFYNSTKSLQFPVQKMEDQNPLGIWLFMFPLWSNSVTEITTTSKKPQNMPSSIKYFLSRQWSIVCISLKVISLKSMVKLLFFIHDVYSQSYDFEMMYATGQKTMRKFYLSNTETDAKIKYLAQWVTVIIK